MSDTTTIATKNHVGHQIAKFLAAFSLLLGFSELIWPGPIARFIGLADFERLVMIYGVREIIAGIGIFAAVKFRAAWVGFRVGGDILDIGTIFIAFSYPAPPYTTMSVSLIMLVGVMLLDIWCARVLSDQLEKTKPSK